MVCKTHGFHGVVVLEGSIFIAACQLQVISQLQGTVDDMQHV